MQLCWGVGCEEKGKRKAAAATDTAAWAAYQVSTTLHCAPLPLPTFLRSTSRWETDEQPAECWSAAWLLPPESSENKSTLGLLSIVQG